MSTPNETQRQLLTVLASSPEGLRTPEILARLPERISQPTLSRRLQELRDQGQIVVEGKARATCYRAARPGLLADLRNRALHEAAAHRLAADPALRERVAQRLEQLRKINPHGAIYHDRWQNLLQGPLPRLLRVLHEDSEDADAMRSESPFTILVDQDTRRHVFERFRTQRVA